MEEVEESSKVEAATVAVTHVILTAFWMALAHKKIHSDKLIAMRMQAQMDNEDASAQVGLKAASR